MIRFNVDEDMVQRFSKADCWALAMAINTATGWTICTVEPRGSDGSEWFHAVNRRPDGMIVDILGVSSVEETLARWDYLCTDAELGAWTREQFDEEMNSGWVEKFAVDSEKVAEHWVARNLEALSAT